ncbi:hypothetical protein [Morganella morganii]|uniref:hypothetical protein n=1 Tax=Morganella morganii TaxID=582 RepID=UPI001C437C93|nr:hypothetical protein [Morganella morganii]QXO71409.1 hypothetical protein JC793_11155 [Morganella morganii]
MIQKQQTGFIAGEIQQDASVADSHCGAASATEAVFMKGKSEDQSAIARAR